MGFIRLVLSSEKSERTDNGEQVQVKIEKIKGRLRGLKQRP